MRRGQGDLGKGSLIRKPLNRSAGEPPLGVARDRLGRRIDEQLVKPACGRKPDPAVTVSSSYVSERLLVPKSCNDRNPNGSLLLSALRDIEKLPTCARCSVRGVLAFAGQSRNVG